MSKDIKELALQFKSLAEKATKEEKEAMNEIWNRWECAETELAVQQAKREGKWPVEEQINTDYEITAKDARDLNKENVRRNLFDVFTKIRHAARDENKTRISVKRDLSLLERDYLKNHCGFKIRPEVKSPDAHDLRRKVTGYIISW